MLTGDPRTLLHAAGGCNWPTVPAYRYGFKCPTGTGPWSVLNNAYMVFEFRGAGPDHDLAYWDAFILPLAFTRGIIVKQRQPGTNNYTWTLEVEWGVLGNISIKTVPGDPDGCNENVLVPHMVFPLIPGFESGDDSSLIPVEFDDTEPPWPWPPM